MIPNLIIPGAAKSGTSSLHEYLNLHPKIEMSRIKEPHFFTFDFRYKAGLSFYKDLFSNKDATFYGESSTAYLHDDVSIERIAKDLPAAKLIVTLREPTTRAISHYLWQVGLKQEFRSFRKAVEYNIKKRIDWRKPGAGGHFKAYYECSLYGKRIEKLLGLFGENNVHVITTKELSKNVDSTLKGCFEFLGLEPIEIQQKINSNKTLKLEDPSTLLKNFVTNSVFRGVVDFRLPYLAMNRRIGKISEKDKEWLAQCFAEDVSLLSSYYPDISKRW
jgi:hypothetical protein